MSASAGHVFVSHSSDNRELARELAAFLEAKGISVWIAPRDVRPGMDYSEELQRAIEGCCAFVILVTDTANKSPYVRAETEMAFSGHKPIFPVRTADVEPAAGLAFFLKIRHWTDAFGPGRADSLMRLVSELKAHQAGAAPAAPAQVEAEIPTPASAPEAEAVPAAPPPPPVQPPAPAAQPATAPAAAPALAQSQFVARPVAHAAAGVASLSGQPAIPDDPELIEAAVGPNYEWYKSKWEAMDAKNSKFSWNWPACLVNVFWFAWRKMWLPMIGLVVALIVLGIIGGAGETAARMTTLLSIGISFVTGTFGNHLYRVQTRRLVASTSGLDRDSQIAALRRRGGTSVPALIISLVIVGFFALLLMAAVIVGAGQQIEIRQQDGVTFSGEEPAQEEGGEIGGTVDLKDR